MSEHCYHCNEPVPDNFNAQVQFDGELRPTCCYGCQAVMQAIIDADLADYYRHRTEPAVLGQMPNDLESVLDSLRIFDEPEFTQQLLIDSTPDSLNTEDTAEVVLSVEGIRCGACVWLLERMLRSLPGVQSVSVNGSTHRAQLRFNIKHVQLSEILHRIQRMGYQALPFDSRQSEQRIARESREQIQRLFVAGIAMMQVMMYALPGYLTGEEQISPAHMQLLRWASMVLTMPVIAFSAAPFFYGALRSVRSGSMGMDVPVTIGITAAFCASVWSTLGGRGETYFDSVSMFVFLLLLARYLEWAVRCRALRSIDDVGSRSVDTANQLVNGEIQRVPAVRLKVGDIVRIDSGEMVPVDGTLLSDNAMIDCSVLSGESKPVCTSTGAAIPAGAQVAGAPVVLQVSAQQKYSTLSVIGRLIERGAAEKPALVNTADKVAHYFVWCLLGFAAFVFICWWWLDPERAATVAITVLVVSCPCALSLATPAALAASTSRLLNSRILITRGHVLETVAQVTDVVLDKTGTLTHGAPRVVSVQIAGDGKHDDAIAMAAALEEGAAHPFAVAIHGLYDECKHEKPPLHALVHEAGSGVAAATDNARHVRLGSADWCRLDSQRIAAFSNRFETTRHPYSLVYLCEAFSESFEEPVVLARFILADTLREESADVVRSFTQAGLTVHLLSGDQDEVVEDCADQLGIRNRVAGASPHLKQQYVKCLQEHGARVLMVGDGINDAPVLASADVSVAMGNATSLARTSADAISLSSDLNVLPMLWRQGLYTKAVVKQNLLWALTYNIAAIPAASIGLIAPWMAALGMAGSSLLVAANAARLLKNRGARIDSVHRSESRGLVWNH